MRYSEGTAKLPLTLLLQGEVGLPGEAGDPGPKGEKVKITTWKQRLNFLTFLTMLAVPDMTAVVVGRVRWDLLVCLVERVLGEPLETMGTGAQKGRRATLD